MPWSQKAMHWMLTSSFRCVCRTTGHHVSAKTVPSLPETSPPDNTNISAQLFLTHIQSVSQYVHGCLCSQMTHHLMRKVSPQNLNSTFNEGGRGDYLFCPSSSNKPTGTHTYVCWWRRIGGEQHHAGYIYMHSPPLCLSLSPYLTLYILYLNTKTSTHKQWDHWHTENLRFLSSLDKQKVLGVSKM